MAFRKHYLQYGVRIVKVDGRSSFRPSVIITPAMSVHFYLTLHPITVLVFHFHVPTYYQAMHIIEQPSNKPKIKSFQWLLFNRKILPIYLILHFNCVSAICNSTNQFSKGKHQGKVKGLPRGIVIFSISSQRRLDTTTDSKW